MTPDWVAREVRWQTAAACQRGTCTTANRATNRRTAILDCCNPYGAACII